MNKKMKASLSVVAAAVAVMGLSACVSDGSYSSMSVGVSSYDRGYDGPYRGGYGYRGGPRAHADYDRDGVPNWADRAPRNPWRD